MLPATTPSVKRFIRDAAAVNIGVAVTGFNGGWSAWYNLGDLPVDHLMPSPEMMFQAAVGDNGAIRSLVLLAAEADDRGIELVAPRVDAGLSVHAMTQLGFAYSEGPLTEAIKVLPERLEYTPKTSSAG
jgi:EAL domain-containing protein (putative c-di-GMP-specific phosphodiesterase class I)